MTTQGFCVHRGVTIRLRALAVALLAFALVALAITTNDAAAHPSQGTHCYVPNVTGDTLAKAERLLRAAHCAAGSVNGSGVGSRVGAQLPKGGASELLWARVALIVAPPNPQPVGIPGTWKLILDSEFTGGSLDRSIWRTGWASNGISTPVNRNELDCYSPSNVYLGGGSLHLDVTAQPSTCGGVTEPYTAAMITTNPARARTGGFQYTYGVMEAKVYLPGDGSLLADWPGLWADGQDWPGDGENDVIEGLNGSGCWSFHNPAGMTHGCDGYITPGWHTFASDWQPGSITYYYDGIDVGVVTSGVTSSPMFLVLGNGVHNNEPTVTEPDSMLVQYVRVWQSG